MLTRALHPCLLLSSAITVQATEWTQYRGPSGDGHTPDKIAFPMGGAAPKQVWKAPSEGGFSSFAVSEWPRVHAEPQGVDGAKQESLVALDAKTGKELWFSALNVAKYARRRRFGRAARTRAAMARAPLPRPMGPAFM